MSHSGMLSSIGIPLVSSVSPSFALGLARVLITGSEVYLERTLVILNAENYQEGFIPSMTHTFLRKNSKLRFYKKRILDY
jgi:hypothetical protein